MPRLKPHLRGLDDLQLAMLAALRGGPLGPGRLIAMSYGTHTLNGLERQEIAAGLKAINGLADRELIVTDSRRWRLVPRPAQSDDHSRPAGG
jgi:hypothetical protein